MATAASPPVYEGEADFHYPPAGKPLKTWYKVTGDLKTSKATPLIILHGGPGVGCSAYNPLADLTIAHSIPIIQYDQVGCGRSSHLREKESAGIEFWNDGLFVAKLESLIAHLGLGQYDVLGHSWGAMFGSRFAAKQPKGLRKYIIMSSAPSMSLWTKAQITLRDALPQEVQDTLIRCEDDGDIDNEEYRSALQLFLFTHLCRLEKMPKEILHSFGLQVEDPTVSTKMWGPLEFSVTGTLKDWSVVDIVEEIDVPTLLLNGRFDTAHDLGMIEFFIRLPRAKWIQFSESSHMAHYEERARFMEVVGEWLRED